MLTNEQYDGPAWPEDFGTDPIKVFEEWFQAAVDAGSPEVNACCLATSTLTGQPSARMVLFKGIDERGLRFYSNYESRKAQEMAENPQAAMVFWWEPLKRQVRIEGKVERCEAEVSDQYFEGRPRASQLGAWASDQSQPIADREQLEKRLQDVELKFEGLEVGRPENWGGYRLRPSAIEFWQGRPNRLHDRRRFELVCGIWQSQLLMP